MLPDEVRMAVEYVDQIFDDADNGEWATIKAHLLAREAEVERLQAIERERWGVVATRNAAVMRAERAEALLRECADFGVWPSIRDRITAHLSENSR